MSRLLNFTPSPKDQRDHTFSISSTLLASSSNSTSTGTSITASSVDLSTEFTSVKDQGDIGSCTAYAGIALFEYNCKKFTKSNLNDIFSERFTYYTTRAGIAKWDPKNDSGAYLRDTLKSLNHFGSCLETTFPYLTITSTGSVCNFAEEPSKEAYQEALKYQALTYANITTGTTLSSRQTALNTLKGCLQKGIPFIGGFTCYSNLYEEKGGVIPVPKTGDSIIGGHAVCFVGYDDTKQLFKFKNSWSHLWGDNGYGYLPYHYLLTGNLTDLWVIYTQENNDISIGIPQTTKNILEQAIANGLIEISQNRVPVVPDSLTESTKSSLRSFFNRIILMKRQVK